MMTILMATVPSNMASEGDNYTLSFGSEMNENNVMIIDAKYDWERQRNSVKTNSFSAVKKHAKKLAIFYQSVFGLDSAQIAKIKRNRSILSGIKMTTAIGVGIVFPFALVGMMAEDNRLPVMSREEILQLAVTNERPDMRNSDRLDRTVRIPINRWTNKMNIN